MIRVPRPLATNVKVYFCDPQSPWQRGSNEQINGLLRQYLRKGMDLSGIHQNSLNAFARQLNEGPRDILNLETPAERFSQCVASTGCHRSRKQKFATSLKQALERPVSREGAAQIKCEEMLRR